MAEYNPYPWHEAEMRRFQLASEQQRLPHAILLTGPEGTGKRHLAQCLVRYVLEQSGGTGNYQDLLDAGSHPDVTLIEPEEEKKQISVDQIRDLTDKIALTPQLSSIKIAVIHPAQAMNRNAANALLKTLEEPQGNALLLLISHNRGMLPQTIVSRCQQLHLAIPPAAMALSWLEAQGIERATDNLHLVGGAPLKAVLAAQNDWLQQYESLLADLSRLLHRKDNMVSVAARWRGLDTALLLGWLKSMVRSLVSMNISQQSSFNMPSNVLKVLKISHDEIDLRQLIQYAEFLDKTLLEVDNNLNQEMMYEQIFSRWSALKQAA
jgi:DNA polymerase-3 subunit delta'